MFGMNRTAQMDRNRQDVSPPGGLGHPANLLGNPQFRNRPKLFRSGGPGSMPSPAAPAGIVATPEDQAEQARLEGMFPQADRLPRAFDYSKAKQVLMGGAAEQSNGLGTRLLGEGWGQRLAALGGVFMGDPNAAARYHQGQAEQAAQMQQARAQLLDWQRDDYESRRDADLHASRPFTIGRDRLQYNPGSGDVTTLYNGAEDFELYARGLGLEEGSPEYFQAVEDYILRSSGPSAFERDLSLDDHRTENDRGLEAFRHSNRLGLEGVRQGNRVELRRTPPARSGRASGGSRGASRGGVSVRRGEPTATGANGETLVVRGGAWVPAE